MCADLITTRFCIGDAFKLSISVSPDGHLIACDDVFGGRTSIRTVPEGSSVAELAEECGIASVFLGDQSVIASCGIASRSIVIFDIINKAIIRRFTWTGMSVGDYARLRFDRVSKRLALITSDWIRVWDLQISKEVAFLEFKAGSRGLDAFFARDIIILYSRSEWTSDLGGVFPSAMEVKAADDLSMDHYLINYRGEMPIISCDGSLAIFCLDTTLRCHAIWNRSTPFRLVMVCPPSTPSSFAISPDGQFMVSGDCDGQLFLWESKSGIMLNQIGSWPFAPHFLYSARFNHIAVVCNGPNLEKDETLFIDPLAKTVLGRTEGHPMFLERSHVFSQDKRWFISASTDQSLPYQAKPAPSGTVFCTDLSLLCNQ